MNLTGIFKNIWVLLAALFVGRCFVFGINPFAPAFIVAVSLVGGNGLLAYIGTVVGIATVCPLNSLIRYSIMLLGILAIMNNKYIACISERKNIKAIFAGLFCVMINVSVFFIIPNVIAIDKGIIEGVIVGSFSIIYMYAINTLKVDYMKITVENEALVSVIILMTTILLGMPDKIFTEIVVADTFCIFTIMFALYKFGFGVGISWTAICSIVMSMIHENQNYFSGWVLVAIVTFAIFCVIRCGRIVYAFIFGGIYYFYGSMFSNYLVSENGIKALCSSIMLFVLLPTSIMVRIDEKTKTDDLSGNSPEWGRLVMKRINMMANAFKRIDYTLASDTVTGIGFSEVGNIIDEFTNQIEHSVPLKKTVETKIIENLARRDIQVKNIVFTKNSEGRYEVYVNARVWRGRIVSANLLMDIVSREINIPLQLKNESRRIVSKHYDMICMREKSNYKCKVAVKRFNRYKEDISGDNYYVGDILEGQQLIIIADGMGNGERASLDSSRLIDSLEELLSAGFDKEVSIKIVNSFLAKNNKGEHFTTLDMLLVDTHTGCGKFFKQGAATSYIKRDNWLEMVKSTSLPVGIVENADCEKCTKKFYDNDTVVMISDGVIESIIFENKDDYMMEILQNNQYSEPDEIAESIATDIMAMSGNRLKDDATIIVCKIVKN